MNELIPIMSLIVAALAVFVGPIISYVIAKRQIASTLATSHKQIIAPMRQAWINNLRDLLAEFASSALHYFAAGFEERKDSDYQHLLLLEHRIQLMLNSTETDHQELENFIHQMISSLAKGQDDALNFISLHTNVMKLSRKIVKDEWDVVKEKIDTSEQSGNKK